MMIEQASQYIGGRSIISVEVDLLLVGRRSNTTFFPLGSKILTTSLFYHNSTLYKINSIRCTVVAFHTLDTVRV